VIGECEEPTERWTVYFPQTGINPPALWTHPAKVVPRTEGLFGLVPA